MADLRFSLHPKQLEVFTSKARYKVVAAGRRAGKSYLACVMLLIEALKDENKYGYKLKNKEVWYIAPTFNQAKDIMWGLLKDLGSEVIVKTIENTGTAELVNGRRIQLKGSDRPDTLRGSGNSFVVMDEFAFMKPTVWDVIVQPTLADVKGSALFIGTPDGKNHFYDLWIQAQREDMPDWEAFHFNSTDNPLIDPDEIEKARTIMSPEAFRQEFEASFEASGSGAFDVSLLQYVDESPFEDGLAYIAVDPAGFSDGELMTKTKLKRLDEFAIAVVDVSPKGWFIKDILHGRWGIREASLRILKAAQDYRPVAVGIEKGSLKNALMPYLEDQMKRLGVYPRIEPLTHGSRKKTERIMWALQGRLQNRRLFVKRAPWNKQFEQQLIDFPNPMVHDDLIDAVSYIDQIATTVYPIELVAEQWTPLDNVAGY